MTTAVRVEVRCPQCKRYFGWRVQGAPPHGYYCRDCKIEWSSRS